MIGCRSANSSHVGSDAAATQRNDWLAFACRSQIITGMCGYDDCFTRKDGATSATRGDLVKAVAKVFRRAVINNRVDTRVKIAQTLCEHGDSGLKAEDVEEVAAEDVDVHG